MTTEREELHWHVPPTGDPIPLGDLPLSVDDDRGSTPAKVGFWVGLRMFSYVRTPTKLTNAISKTQLLGKKRGGSRQKYPECGPFFVFGVF